MRVSVQGRRVTLDAESEPLSQKPDSGDDILPCVKRIAHVQHPHSRVV